MKPIIRVTDLGKQYTLGAAKAAPYATLRESLVRAARKPLSLVRGNGRRAENRFWALKDVSFDVMPGEVVGIIGRNGAGKSTLLKILSRITEPTTGRVDLYGRVGSLLEVGTGFHPELTGRENVYLNGAILGMRREEIRKKFDEIVDFAEIEEFLDTPVKHYSSGMYIRLAFAVAAHLEPEILVVDEVLAVGDAQFQKKCLGKIKDVSRHGRTVLFVSHNLGSLSQICDKGMLLKKGELIARGTIADTIRTYSRSDQEDDSYLRTEIDPLKEMQLREVFVTNRDGIMARDFNHDEPITVHIRIHVNNFVSGACYYIALFNKYKERIASDVVRIDENALDDQAQYMTYEIPAGLLAPNAYSLWASILVPRIVQIDDAVDVCPIQVHDAGTTLSAFYQYEHGYLQLNGKWDLRS